MKMGDVVERDHRRRGLYHCLGNFIGYRVHSMSARDFVGFGIAGCRRDFAGCRRRGYRRGTSVVAEEEDIDVGLPRLQKKTSTWDFRGCRRRYRRGTSRMQKKRISTLLDFVEFQRNYLFINRDIIFLHIMLDEVFCHVLKNG